MSTVFQKTGKPFLPERPRPHLQFVRSAFAHTLAAKTRQSPEAICKERWPNDEASAMVVRGVAAPASLSTPAWAGNAVPTATADFIGTLAPQSATAEIFARAGAVPLDGVSQITIPRRAALPAAGDVTWVEPGAAIPVGQLTVTGTTLGPAKKLAVIVVATNELLASSAAEAVFTSILKENVSVNLDATFFSNVAATDARPAGILNGISALSATADGGDAAMIGDLDKLATAISNTAGDIVIVANSRQAFSIRIRLGTRFDIPVIASRAVPAGTLVALDPAALAVAFGPVPRFDSSTETVVHMSDTPTEISSVDTTNTVAAPVRSLYQSDCVATRCILPVAYAVRSPGAIAWISGATW